MEVLQGTEGQKRFMELVKGIRFAMLTTQSENMELRSRPMFTQDIEFDGELWFFTSASSGKVDEIVAQPQVNVAYAKPESSMYVSASGTARVVRDRTKIHELWKEEYKIYFENGPDDPDVVLLSIAVSEAEYWTGERNPVLRLVGIAKAFITKDPSALGEQGRIELSGH
jgi:general stress protein 26